MPATNATDKRMSTADGGLRGHRGPPNRLGGVAVLAMLSLAWTLMTLWDFGLPGLYFDEVNHYAFIPGLLSEEAARLPHYRLADNWIDLRDGVGQYPILGGTIYNSLLRTYIGLPFFLAAGFSLESIRLFSALLGLAAILYSASLVGRLFGWLPALLFGLVVITDPTSVFSLRAQGGLFWMLILFATVAAHALLVAWQRRDHPPWWTAIVAGASIALAVASYFVGVFVAVPLVACGIAIYWRHPWRLAAFLVAGIIAYSPVLYALWSIHVQTPQHFANFGHASLDPSRPTVPLAESLKKALDKLQGALGSHRFAGSIVGGLPRDFSLLRIAAVVAAIATWLVVAMRGRIGRKPRGLFLAIIAFVAIVYVVALLKLTSLNLHHLIPFSVMLTMAICCLVAIPGIPRAVGGCVVAILLATNSIAMLDAHSSLQRTGGRAYHNEAYSLPASLMTEEAYRDHYPVFAAWGFHLQYLFQTRGERPYAFMATPDADRIRKLLGKHGKLAVFVDRRDRDAFLDGFQPDSERRFQQRDGQYLYSLMLLSRDSGPSRP